MHMVGFYYKNYKNVTMLSAMRTGHVYTQDIILVLISVRCSVYHRAI